MSISIETYALSRKYTDGSISGITGTLAGKNCTIQSITEIEGGNRVTFEWTDNGGTTRTSVLDVMDGKGIQSIAVNENNHLIITYSDGTTSDAGEIEITAAVNSVNEKTGDVVLTADDLSAYTKTETDDKIETEIGKLDVEDTAVEGSYVTEVSETDGKIAVVREASDSTPTEDSKKMIQSGGVYTALATKQDTLTFDDAPTEDSDNPVKSGGVYNSLADKMSYEDNGILGAKNLFNFDAWKNVPVYKGTAEWGDNSLTLTATENDAYTGYYGNDYPEGARIYVEEGKTYIMTWECGDTAGNAFIFRENTGSTGAVDSVRAKKLLYTVPSGVSYIIIRFGIANAGGTNTFSNIMVRLADDTDTTYQPYAETNRQLTKNKVDWKNNGILGAKNLLQNKGTTMTSNGVTFTVNDDGSVTTSGTSESAVWFPLLEGTDTIAFLNSLESGKDYVLSGVPDSADSDISITIWNYGEVARAHANDDKEFRKPSPVSTNSSNISIGTDATGVSFDGLTFYPMVRFADDTDDTYRPYAMTNKQLTDSIGINTLSDLSDVNVSSLTNGQILAYDSTSSKWVNQNATSSGNLIITENVTLTLNISANAQVELSTPNNAPEGYEFLGVVSWQVYVGTSGVASIFRAAPDSTGTNIVIGVASTVARSNGTVTVKIAYIKSN